MADGLAKRSKTSSMQSSQGSKRKYEDTSGDAAIRRAMENGLNDIREMISCRICVHPMFEPYTTECGHTFCYGCLIRWFEQDKKRKSCPDCRANVTTQPSPSYALRDITHVLASRAELLPAGETTEENNELKTQEKEKVELDRASRQGLFSGLFSRRMPVVSIPDHSDGVLRCPHCTWEVEGGTCSYCGWSDGVETTGGTSDDGDNSENDWMNRAHHHLIDLGDRDVINLEEERDLIGDGHDLQYDGHTNYDSFLDSTEEEDDDDTLGGFVVNDNDDRTGDVTESHHSSTGGSSSGSSGGEEVETSEPDSTESDEPQRHIRRGSLPVRGANPHLRWAEHLPARPFQRYESSMDSDRSSMERSSGPSHRVPGLGEDSSDSDPSEGSIQNPRFRRGPRPRSRRVVDISDDEHDERENSNVSPTSRQAYQQNRIWSSRGRQNNTLTSTRSPIFVDSSPSRPESNDISQKRREQSIPGAYPPSFSHSEASQNGAYNSGPRDLADLAFETSSLHALLSQSSGNDGSSRPGDTRSDSLQGLQQRARPLFPPRPPQRAHTTSFLPGGRHNTNDSNNVNAPENVRRQGSTSASGSIVPRVMSQIQGPSRKRQRAEPVI
ncbi:uncharacterized protein KY384_009113 [Bacidia gigantensis]|uniref:uncharacterized protein n=1 Tax=Bacidia gigantensis TaxID=2732470 RepID=UPI001D058D00|nr:uncharacterized protein KY384_009113 [Bacidia gigantensis]KAG8525469.1 hypothetical protein KY384_009113 [Bacidia gigantensis]